MSPSTSRALKSEPPNKWAPFLAFFATCSPPTCFRSSSHSLSRSGFSFLSVSLRTVCPLGLFAWPFWLQSATPECLRPLQAHFRLSGVNFSSFSCSPKKIRRKYAEYEQRNSPKEEASPKSYQQSHSHTPPARLSLGAHHAHLAPATVLLLRGRSISTRKFGKR